MFAPLAIEAAIRSSRSEIGCQKADLWMEAPTVLQEMSIIEEMSPDTLLLSPIAICGCCDDALHSYHSQGCASAARRAAENCGKSSPGL
jgi:hypothetical protein